MRLLIGLKDSDNSFAAVPKMPALCHQRTHALQQESAYSIVGADERSGRWVRRLPPHGALFMPMPVWRMPRKIGS
jgi:hypothetical protein